MTRTARTAAFALPLLVLAGCAGPLPAGAAMDATADDGPSTVVYEVTGPAAANNITYSAGGSSANIAQEQGVTLPWTKTVEMSGPLNVATLAAQNSGSGDITCRITLDGKPVAEVTSSGRYAVVNCASEAF